VEDLIDPLAAFATEVQIIMHNMRRVACLPTVHTSWFSL